MTLLESRTLLATTTVTTLMLSAPSLTYGQTENLTATVTNPAGGESPTGSVSFMDGSTLLNTQQAAPSPAGVAMYTTTATQLPAGTDDLTAVYNPTGSFASSSSATTRFITTVVGGGVGDEGPATNASVYQPYGVALDAFGDVFIADSEHNLVAR